MTRIQEYIDIIRGVCDAPLSGSHPCDRVLLDLLVHAAFADGILKDAEFELLSRLMPGQSMGNMMVWVANTAQEEFDVTALLQTFPDPSQRGLVAELAEHMVAIDTNIKASEIAFVDALCRELGR